MSSSSSFGCSLIAFLLFLFFARGLRAGSEEIALFVSSGLRRAFPLLEEAGRRLHLLTHSSCLRIGFWAERGRRANEGLNRHFQGFPCGYGVSAGRADMRLVKPARRCNSLHGMDPSHCTRLRYRNTTAVAADFIARSRGGRPSV